MSSQATLLYLHGVGSGDPEETWKHQLDQSLQRLGHRDLTSVNVVAPRYPNALNGVDEEFPLPEMTIKTLRGEDADRNRRWYERRRTAMEVLLGRDAKGGRVPGDRKVAAVAAEFNLFVQARNYVDKPDVRAWTLRHILKQLPTAGRLVIVGHSLGSVIAADLLRRLPPDIHVAGLITIGSPLAHDRLHVDDLRNDLAEPPSNLSWWVNFWSPGDPVPTRRGASTVFPWVLDQQISRPLKLNLKQAHSALEYLADDTVTLAISRGLFGSPSTEIELKRPRSGVGLNAEETTALLALRLAHLTLERLDDDVAERYADALRHTQATAYEELTARITQAGRSIPDEVADIRVDLSNENSLAVSPQTPMTMSIAQSITPLIRLATSNVVKPFEIDVPDKVRNESLEQLTLEMGLGRAFGTNVLDALDEAHKALKDPVAWRKMAFIGAGAAAVIAATGGIAFVATPGLAGAAALTSGLAAFGPGGMIGGLLTAGSLVGLGGGSITYGLASSGISAAAVEGLVASTLAAAILRKKQGRPLDPECWTGLVELESEVAKELARLKPISDEDADSVKELERKREAVKRALDYLHDHDLEPEQLPVAAEGEK